MQRRFSDPVHQVPDATGDLQKATDIGTLGIMVPLMTRWKGGERRQDSRKYPPIGRRSQGNNQAGSLWGGNYRQTINDNLMIIAMIENPAGVAIAEKIAAVPGIDGLFVASTDLGSFSGLRQGDAKYTQSLVNQVVAVVRRRDARARRSQRVEGHAQGYNFFQAGDEAVIIRAGARATLGQASGAGPGRGVAPIEEMRRNKWL